MNDDLNASLHRAVDSALDQAMTADQMHRAVAERIRAKRRRRPALIIGSTLGSLALVGGTAFAAIQLIGDDDRPRVPDVIGSPRPEGPASPTPTEEPASLAPTEEPTPAPPAPEPDPVITFPVADPSAVFPECGAVVEALADHTDLMLQTFVDDRAPFPTTLTSHLWAPTDEVRGEVTTQATAVAVKDGIVVGSTDQTQPRATTPYAVGMSMPSPATLPSTVRLTLCTDGTTPLPAGRYSVWGSVDFTVTERTPVHADFSPGIPVAANDTGRTRERIGSLWMSADGSVVAHPGVAAGWPENLDESTAFSGLVTAPTVVWLQASEYTMYDDIGDDPAFEALRDQLGDLGYLGQSVPFVCQSAAPAALGLGDDPALVDRLGFGLVFTTRTDAEDFVSRWEPLHGPVAGTVTANVGCSFD